MMGLRSSKLIRLTGFGRANKRLRLRGRAPLMAATPRGYVPICVGLNNDTRLFIVHTTSFDDADFMQFLCKSAEEYGFYNKGILRIPYEAKEFEDWMITRANPKVKVKPL